MPLKPNGKLYKVNGEEVVLYPIGKLVEALKKSGYTRGVQTIRKWEDTGVVPPATFRSGGKRLYSLEQIETFVKVAKECDIRQGLAISSTDFSERIWEELSELNNISTK